MHFGIWKKIRQAIFGIFKTKWGKRTFLIFILYTFLFALYFRYIQDKEKGIVTRIGDIIFYPYLIAVPTEAAKSLKERTQAKSVTVIKIEKKNMAPYVNAPGAIDFVDRIDSFSKVNGRLEKVYVEEGESVHRGQKLFKMETLPLELELMKLKATMESSQAQVVLAREKYLKAKEGIDAKLGEIEKAETVYKRAKEQLEKTESTFKGLQELYKIEGLTQEEMKKARLDLHDKEAQYLLAKKDLKIKKLGFTDEKITQNGYTIPKDPTRKREILREINTKIEKAELQVAEGILRSHEAEIRATETMIKEAVVFSPLEGVVAKKYKTEGEVLSSSSQNEAVVTLINLDTVYAVFNVSEEDSVHIHKNMQVNFTADVYPEKRFTGIVYIVSPIVDSKAHTVQIKAKVKNRRHELKPGMFVRAQIYTGKTQETLLAPNSALIPVEDGSIYVYLIDGGYSYKTKIEIGQKYEDEVEVIKGLKEGDTIAIDRLSQLREGMEVSPVTKE